MKTFQIHLITGKYARIDADSFTATDRGILFTRGDKKLEDYYFNPAGVVMIEPCVNVSEATHQLHVDRRDLGVEPGFRPLLDDGHDLGLAGDGADP